MRPRLSEFVQAHDDACVEVFLSVGGHRQSSAHTRRAAGVPMNLGGLGLCLASGSAEAAHWASWADCIPSVKRRVAETMVTLLSHHPGPSFVVRECANMLRESQFVVPPWEAVLAGLRPGHEDDENPVELKHGWQKPAARAVHEQRVARVIWPNLTDPERALQQRPDGVPNVPVNSDRPATFPRFVVPSSPTSSSLLFPHLPMWPSPLPWPPSSSVRGSRGFGSKGICIGTGSRTGVQRRRWSRVHECDGQEPQH